MSRWTSWFFVAACSSSPTTKPPAKPVVAPPPPPSLAAIAGPWGGMGYQPDVEMSFEIQMTIEPDAAIGARVGRIDYPRSKCGGDLIRIASPASELRAREQLTANQDNVCVDGGSIVVPVTPSADDTLDFKWLFPDGKVGATATLGR